MKRVIRHIAVTLVWLLSIQILPIQALAQTAEIEEVRDERDRVREERVRAAADLDPLKAANEEIERSLEILKEDLAARTADLAATQARLEQAEVEIQLANEEVLVQQGDIAALRVELQHQAINAYVSPGSVADQEILASVNPTESERRRALVSAVNTTQVDVIDRLRIAEAELEASVRRTELAKADLAEREAQLIEDLEEMDAAVQRQIRLEIVLEERIEEFVSEVEAHEAAEDALNAELAGLIADEEARQAAARRAAEIAAERARVARELEAARQAQLLAQAQAQAAAREAAARGIAPPQQTEQQGPAPVDQSNAALVGAPQVTSGLLWPAQGVLTSKFGPRWGRQHNGIDIGANTGTTIIAAASGTVVAAGPAAGFGNRVIINHGDGFVTLYAHMNVINTSQGASVSAGTPIGTVGCTGICTGPHLHFETRVNGVAYNPLNYLS